MAKTEKPCHACGYAPTALNPLVEAKDGKKVHKSHINDPNSGYYKKSK